MSELDYAPLGGVYDPKKVDRVSCERPLML